ncbi:aldose 1-epimerase [Marilutibacter aestuarii]|uniref:Aldose epimerase n=1 Tax=Marilutibacter aestuarii TaxID=1706195 RepID=A0A508AR36_9GAMM|nr:aldose epimerase [Lysobacter aestuarii]TQD50944.1 aldose epimerase [Lysobacter aestuarii]
MAADPARAAWDDAMAPMPPGPLCRLRHGPLEVALAPEAGGRLAQIRFAGVDWLLGPEEAPATIAWGCYPMLPWAGRLRGGRFELGGRSHQLRRNFGAHAIHGIGYSRPWEVGARDPRQARLSLSLPRDDYWPFGGIATQSVTLGDASLQLALSVQAGDHAMPVTLGWHPWFRKPERLLFAPEAMYPRDASGITTAPPGAPGLGPWDDCFIAHDTIVLEREGQRLGLRADTDHWVVYDGDPSATCVEPQTGPPDAFNLAPRVLSPGQRVDLAFELSWRLEHSG